jgi:hypothetical protein
VLAQKKRAPPFERRPSSLIFAFHYITGLDQGALRQ